jgi:hypothetical protein
LAPLAGPTRAHVRAVAAAEAFRALRAVADPAVPELKRRAVLTNAPLTKGVAVVALVQIGSEAAIDAIIWEAGAGRSSSIAPSFAGSPGADAKKRDKCP